jgi:DNA-binding SARP family transcriptional activator
MAHLAICMLGPLQIAAAGQAVTGFRYDKVRALLLYLVVEAHHPCTRDELAALLWPEESQHAARTSLRQAVGHLRQALGAETASELLTITPTTLQFNPAGDYELDVATFSTLLDACDTHVHRHAVTCASCTERRQSATALYQGDFLQGFFLRDSAPFEEWALVKRGTTPTRARIAGAADGILCAPRSL